MTTGDGRDDEPMWPMAAPAQAGVVPAQAGPGSTRDGSGGGADGRGVVTDGSGASAVAGDLVSGESGVSGAGLPQAEAVAGVPSGGGDEPEVVGRAGRKRPRAKVIALVAGLAVIVAVVVAGGIALNVYDQQTKIDRSTPTLAVSQLVDAMFTARDESTVARFSCKKADLGALRRLMTNVKDQEARFHTHISVAADEMKLSSQSVVEARLSLTGEGWNNFQNWAFETANQDGWRVCSARQLT
ncbi:hypothetical protein Lfu02_31020 [Longispora fulva]|uniref:Uncharacterized protein n=1 Tax=Longispora fulva TaxID=619741 RepID=A0A8J7KMJ9_9ACTN|nr:hypothetical protein [Longispora fulva]MBG6139236.1 hypothetical protein [Longispora fulva]GIG58730.1 hypothetical protein Lfu02_31020 [Longispora fulva]